MNEKTLIKQLKVFKGIEPSAQWAFNLKNTLLKKEEPATHFMSFQTNWQFMKPASMIGGFSIACLLIAMMFLGVFSKPIDYTEINQLAGSLNELEMRLNNVAFNLQENNDLVDAGKTLEMQQAIETVVKESRETVAKAKEESKNLKKDELASQEFLAVLDRVENALQMFEKQAVEREIANLTSSVLSDKQKELFEKAKEYYEKGSYQEALIAIIELSQTK